MRWDLYIRLFHWSLAAGIVANYFLLEEGETLHEWVGYVVCALVVLRLLWGFLGPTRARFSTFLKPPNIAFYEMRELASPHTLPNTHTALGGIPWGRWSICSNCRSCPCPSGCFS